MPFNIHNSQAALIRAISNLRPYSMGPRATADELENNAGYIEQLCKLVAEHVEEVMAEAGSSTSAFRIDETDARGLRDIGCDLAGQLNEAAYRTVEEREIA